MKFWKLSSKGKHAWKNELAEWFEDDSITLDTLGMIVFGDDRIYFNISTAQIIGGEMCGGRADSFWTVFEFYNSLVATQEMVKELLDGSDIELPDGIRVI